MFHLLVFQYIGAAFVQALTSFRQECVYKAFQGPAAFALGFKAVRERHENKNATDVRPGFAKPPLKALPDGSSSAPVVDAPVIDIQASVEDSEAPNKQPEDNTVVSRK